MGALFSGPPKPPPIPVQPPAAAPATFASSATQAAGTGTMNAFGKSKAAGVGSTIGTSPQGLKAPPQTANATLLGATS